MAGRIDLNLPPRLIESARAAQYTNREVLGARALEQRIKAKARRRQEAAIRANPRLITPQQREGGQLEFQQAPLQRIWRRPRRVGEVDVGVGLSRYTLAPNTTSDYFEDARYYGSANGSMWTEQIPHRRHLVRFSGNNLEGEYFGSREFVFPMGDQSLLVLVVTMYFSDFVVYNDGKPSLQQSYQVVHGFSARAIVMNDSSVHDYSIPVPAFVLDKAPSVGYHPANYNLLFAFRRDVSGDYLGAKRLGFGWIQFPGLQPLRLDDQARYDLFVESITKFSTSNCYEGINEVGEPSLSTYLQRYKDQKNGLEPVPLNIAFDAYSYVFIGGDESVNDLARLAGRRLATYGDAPGSRVLDNSPPPTPLPLDNELEHRLGALEALPVFHGVNNADPSYFTERDRILLGYDMHGGTYCRDQLTALGITLP